MGKNSGFFDLFEAGSPQEVPQIQFQATVSFLRYLLATKKNFRPNGHFGAELSMKSMVKFWSGPVNFKGPTFSK